MTTTTLVTMITFVPNAELAEPHCACTICEQEWPTRTLKAIISDELYIRYTQDYSLNRDELLCPECLAAIQADYCEDDGSDEAYENRHERFGRKD